MKISLKSSALAKDMLKRAKQRPVPGIKVLCDRTPAEQDALDALRRELEERLTTDDSLTIRFIRGAPRIIRQRQGNARRQH